MTKSDITHPAAVDNLGEENPAKTKMHLAVGYKQPPFQTRFKKGRSGNPQGRPKQSWSGRSLLKEALETSLTVTENGIARKMPQRDILFRSLLAKAIKGDTRSLAMVLKLVDKWNIYQSEPTVTSIRRIIVEPDGTYYDLDLGRKASIHKSTTSQIGPELRQERGKPNAKASS